MQSRFDCLCCTEVFKNDPMLSDAGASCITKLDVFRLVFLKKETVLETVLKGYLDLTKRRQVVSAFDNRCVVSE